jgi:hypothetical protein
MRTSAMADVRAFSQNAGGLDRLVKTGNTPQGKFISDDNGH